MTADIAIALGRDALVLTLILCGPAVLTILLVGTLVSMLQAVTQIQEQSLAFVPKLIATVIVLSASGVWMIQSLTRFAADVLARIPLLVH